MANTPALHGLYNIVSLARPTALGPFVGIKYEGEPFTLVHLSQSDHVWNITAEPNGAAGFRFGVGEYDFTSTDAFEDGFYGKTVFATEDPTHEVVWTTNYVPEQQAHTISPLMNPEELGWTVQNPSSSDSLIVMEKLNFDSPSSSQLFVFQSLYGLD